MEYYILLTCIVLVIMGIYFEIITNKLKNRIRYLEKKFNENFSQKPKDYENNSSIINSMNNVNLIKFIKERFNLPDYCKMCQRFNPRDTDETACRFKGMTNYCENGFKDWLNTTNNLEGDMDANVN